MNGATNAHSRRDFCKFAAALPLAMAFPPQQHFQPTLHRRMPLDSETFSFHDLPPAGDPQLIPHIITIKSLGINEMRDYVRAHLAWGSYVTGWWVQTRKAPGYAKMREEAREWRLTVPMDYYRNIRKQFEDAGLRIYYYNVNFNETFTDAKRTGHLKPPGNSERKVSAHPPFSARPTAWSRLLRSTACSSPCTTTTISSIPINSPPRKVLRRPWPCPRISS